MVGSILNGRIKPFRETFRGVKATFREHTSILSASTDKLFLVIVEGNFRE